MKFSRPFTILISVLISFSIHASLPFSNEKDFIEYVKNIDFDKIENASPLSAYMTDSRSMPEDPILLKGIQLFNDGKQEESVKHWKKINNYKNTKEQREFAQYQLFHISQFGMVDPYYDGRPSTMDRNNGMYLDGYYTSYPENDVWLSELILKCNYDLPSFDPYVWIEICNSEFNTKRMINSISDLNMLHSLLKASYPLSRIKSLSNFPKPNIFTDIEDICKYIHFEKDNKNIDYTYLYNRYVNTKKNLPKNEVLKKGILLDMKGEHEKSYKYFNKIASKRDDLSLFAYAEYQCWHILAFGEVDPYFDGRPSDISRKYLGEISVPFLQAKKFKNNKCHSIKTNLIKIIEALGALSNSDEEIDLNDYFEWMKYSCKTQLKYSYCKPYICDEDLFDFVLMSIFKPGRNANKLSVNFYKLFYDSDWDRLKYKDFPTMAEKIKIFIPLLSNMKIDDKYNFYGIGLDANKLYSKAVNMMRKSSLELFFDKVYESDDYMNKTMAIYLLRSALWGNWDAMNNLIIISAKDIKRSNSSSNFNWSKELCELPEVFHGIKEFKQYNSMIDSYKVLFDDVFAGYMAENVEHIKQLEREQRIKEAKDAEKKARRSEFWGNIGRAFVDAVMDGLNSYAQTLNNGNAYNSNMNNYGLPNHSVTNGDPSSYNYNTCGPLAAQMSQPGYFQNQYAQLMQLSMSQVQQQEMNEFFQVRESLQRSGKDITLDEYRTLKGQAIMDLKSQNIDIIDDQNKSLKEMSDFNSSVNSAGKRNVERIKQKNAQKYGNSYSSSSTSLASPKSESNTTTNTKVNNRLNTFSSNMANNSSENSLNNTNPQSTSETSKSYSNIGYTYTQHTVNLHENLSSNSAVVFRNCGIYRKGSNYFVKIDEQYYQIKQCNKQHYNSTITYGSHPYYFNL